jgi:hypothetical protein
MLNENDRSVSGESGDMESKDDSSTRRIAQAWLDSLPQDSQMASRIRTMDWSSCLILGPEEWPQLLKTSITAILASETPMAVSWGPDLVFIYNDASIPYLGNKHPDVFAQPSKEGLSEFWDLVESQVEQVLTRGRSYALHNQHLPLNWQEDLADAWFTYSLFPILDAEGQVRGIFTSAMVMNPQKEAPSDRLASAFSAAEGIVYDHHAPLDGEIHVDRGWTRILGYEPEEVPEGEEIVPWVFEKIHPDDHKKMDRIYQDLQAGNAEGYHTELRLQHRQGHYVWVEAHGQIQGKDPSGEAIHIIGMIKDISNQKLMEAALAESKERFQSLKDSVSSGFCVVRLIYGDDGGVTDFEFLEVNDAFLSMSHLQNVKGKRIRQIVPDYSMDWLRIYEQIARTGKKQQFRRRIPFLGNRWHEVQAFGMGEPGQGIIAVLFTDITEKIEIKNSLWQTELKYKELVQYAPVGIYEIDFRGNRFISVNEAMCMMTGYSREELLRLDPFSLLDEQGQALFRQRIGQWLNGQTPSSNPEYRITARDGTKIDTLLNVTFTRAENGEPIGATVIAHDITQRKQGEREIRRYNRVLKAINQILEKAIHARSRESLGRTILSVALDLTGSTHGFISLMNGSGDLLGIAMGESEGKDCDLMNSTDPHHRSLRPMALKGLLGKVVKSQQGFFKNDLDQSPNSTGLPEGHPPLSNFLGIPLLLDGEIYGVVTVGNRQGGYQQEQLDDLESLAPSIVEAFQRQAAEASIHQNEQLYRTLAQNFPHSASFILDSDLCYLLAQGQALSLVGLSPEDFEGKSIWEANPPEVAASYETYFRQAFEGQGFEYEHDVGGRTFISSGVPVYDDQGNIPYVLAVSYDITDRKRSEIALQLSEERLRLASAAAGMGVFEWDLGQDCCKAQNERMLAIFGRPQGNASLSREELVNDFILPEDRADLEAALARAPQNNGFLRETCRIRRQNDGEIRWIDISGQIVQDPESGSLRLIGVCQDITREKIAEEEREQLLAERTAVMDSMTEGLILVNIDGHIIYQNPASIRIQHYSSKAQTRLPREPIMGLWDVYDLDGNPVPEEQMPIRRVMRGETFEEVELHWIRTDISYEYYGSFVGFPVQGRHGETLFNMITFRDITQQILAERKLAKEQDLFQTIYDSIPVMLTVYDPEMNDIEMNKYVHEVTGWMEEDLAGSSIMELAYPDPDYRAEIAEYMRTLPPGFRDISMHTRDGCFIETSWANVRLNDGRQVGIGIDISERKSAEEELRQYANMLELLHDLDESILAARTPGEVARKAVEKISEIIPDCQRVSVVTLDPDRRTFEVLAAYSRNDTGVEIEDENGFDEDCDEFIERLSRGEEVRIDDMSALAEGSDYHARLVDKGIRAVTFYPIRVGKQLVGALSIGFEDEKSIKKGQENIIRELILPISIGMEQSRLHNEVQDHARILERLVTERTKALQESETRLKMAVSAGKMGTYSRNLASGEDYWSPEFLEILGLETGSDVELVDGLPAAIHPDDHARVLEESRRHGKDEAEAEFQTEHRIIRPDGTVRWLQIRGQMEYDQSGKLIRSYGVAMDITERKMADLDLEVQRKLLEAIINHIPVGISLISGTDFRVILANPAYKSLLKGQEMEGQAFSRIWSHLDRDFDLFFNRVLETGEPFFREDDPVTIRRETDGPFEEAFVTWWLFKVNIPGEEAPGLLNIKFETTERRLAQAALIEAEKLTTIGRMAASLAHEINNPIQSVVGCLGLAMELQEEGEDASRFMDVAMDELTRAARIVRRLRDLGKQSDSGREAADVNRLVDKVLVLTQKQAENHLVDVDWAPNRKLPEILLNPDQIQQVFLNLVLNAIEAMPDGGTLTIRTQETANPDGIKVQFKDTGIGIGQDTQEKLFEAFQSTKDLGLGLGLFVSKKIVHQHSGHISVTSELGEGSTFTIWLPLGASSS